VTPEGVRSTPDGMLLVPMVKYSRDEIGSAWREIMGSNYPAMALIEVKGLVESAAKVEIEATAVVPE